MSKPKPLKSVLSVVAFKLFSSFVSTAGIVFTLIYAMKGIAVGNFKKLSLLGDIAVVSAIHHKKPCALRSIALVISIIIGVTSVGYILIKPPTASAATSSYLNFQARLETASGGIAPDGTYNVAFHLYNAASSSGSTDTSCGTDANCLWEETRSGGNQVRVANGYLSVNLGSVTAFGSINWDQQLWLTMDIGGTGGSPSWDGEMNPRIQLTAVPYAFQAQSATQLQASVASNTGTLKFDTTMTGGNQTFVLPDQGAAGSYNLLTQTQANANYIQLQTSTPGTAQTGNFNIGTGTGIAGTFDSVASGTLNLGTSNASTVNIATNGSAHTIALGNGAAVQGITIGSTNSTSSLLLQAGTGNLQIQTQGGTLGIGNNTVAQTITIGNTTGATSVAVQAGSGGIGLQSATTVSANLTVTNAGNVAFQKGTDYSATVGLNDVNFGTGTLIRLTGSSTQTITGIAGGVDGKILTLVNAAGQAAVISNQSASSTAGNRIITGTASDLTLGVDASINLVYDSGASRWRVVGSSASTGTAWLQGGNNFGVGVQGVLGTTDSTSSLSFITGNTSRIVIDTSATTNFTFQQASNLLVGSAATGRQLAIQGGAATGAGNIGGTLLLQGGAGGSGAATGSVIVKANGSNSTTAFAVQDYNGAQVLAIDTSNTAVVIGKDGTPVPVTIRGGAATGSNVQGANLTFDASNGSGAAGSGDLIFRTAGGTGSVTQDATSASGNLGSTSTLTWSHTVASQSNRILIVGLVSNNTTSWTGVKWDPTGANQSLTHLGSTVNCDATDFAYGCHVDLWYLVAPATGTHNIQATSSVAGNNSGGAVSYYNVDQSTPFGTAATVSGHTTGGGGTASVTVSTSTTQLVLGVIGTNNSTSNGNGTQLWNDNFVFYSIGASKPGTGSNVSINWTVNTGDYGIIGVPINAAANSTSDTLADRLHVSASGNVGISNATPQYTLDVTGTGNFTTSVYSPLFDVASAGALSVGTSNATSINVGGTTTTGITIGTAAVNKTISIGATGSTANTTTVNIANTTGNAAQTVNIGATNSANNAVLIQGGTTASAISLQTGVAGTIGIGTNNTANTIQIGSTTLSSGTQTINIGNNGSAGGTTNITIGSTIAGTTTLQSAGGIKITTVGASTANSAALCRDGSTTFLTSCDVNTTGKPFLQGGNTFGAQAVLGTNDANTLAIRTGGTNRIVIDTSGNQQFQQASIINVANATTGTQLTIQGGAATTSGNVGGTLLLQGGAGTSASSGSVIVESNGSNSTSAFQVQDTTGNGLLNVDTTNSQVTISTNTPSTATLAQLVLSQSGTGNTALQFSGPSQSWTIGNDASNNNAFSINSSTVSTGTMGKTTTGANTDSIDQNVIECAQFTASQNGTVTSISAFTGDAADNSPNNKFSMAIYSDSGGVPGTLLGATAQGNLSAAAGLNTLPVNASITSGAKYWLCANNNSTNNNKSNWTYSSSGGNELFRGVTFGTWATTQPGSGWNGGSSNYAFYVTYTVASSFNNSLLALSQTGQFQLHNSTNSTTAFQIQNAAGDDNLFLANTTNTNLIANSSAESDATGWSRNTGSGTQPASTTAQALYGNSALSINTSATSHAGAKYDTTTLLSASTTYTLSFWAKIASGSFTVEAGRSDTDVFGGENATCSGGIQPSGTVTTTWTRYTCTFTTSGTVTTGGYIFIRQSDSTARTWYVDGIQLEQAATATNYREGSLQFNGTITSPTIFQNAQDTNLAFQIQNAAGNALETIDTTNNMIILGTTPSANATRALLQLGSTALSGGSASGTYLGANVSASFAGDLIDFQQAGNKLFQVSSAANLFNGLLITPGSAGSGPAITPVASSTGAGNGDLYIASNGSGSQISISPQGAGTVNIGQQYAGNTSTTNIGDTTSGTLVNIVGGPTVNIGTIGSTASASTINIANTTGNATQTIKIGATNSANNAVLIQGGTTASAISLQTGVAGTIGIGTNNTANTIQIGSTTLSSGTQTINIGNNNTSGGTTNVVIGAGSSATGGTTTLQAKGNITLTTNGTTVGIFDTSSHLYLGNGITTGSPNNFTIQGTGSTTTAVAGGSITLQGGSATVGNANGGTITVAGGTGIGTGVTGSVVITTPTIQTASLQTCASDCTITPSSADNNGAVIIKSTGTGITVTMNNPTITTAGKIVYVTAANGSNDFTLSVNGGGTGNTISMRQNTTATMIWNGSAWTAAGASSSTTLQAAYDNTLTSAGGAELILSNSTNHNGLTIRDSLTSPVSGNGNGTLLEVQTAQAASLFSVNSNVTDYANNGGAESTFGSDWAAAGTVTSVTQNTASTQFIANGIGSVAISTNGNANTGAKNTLTSALTANLRYNVSFTAKLNSGSFTDLEVDYSKDGTNTSSAACATLQTIPTSVWAKVNCTFTAPSSGITSSNAILIRQTAGATRIWYVDNFSVTISADLSYATDGGVDDNTNFATNWPTLGTSTITRDTTTGNDTSDSAKVAAGTTANNGVKNKLAINPLATNPGTLYRISVYALLNPGSPAFSNFSVGYSPDDGGVAGSHFKACADYNTQTLSSTLWTQITCYITTDTTAVSTPRVYFYQPTAPGSARTFFVDTFSMTLATNAVPNVQIGGGVYGGPTTLLTLDRAASAPIASNNDALLGSMYYDTTLGKLQCYEADGWGACGSSPDNIVTISPEYTNAVLHGTGVGTMTSDFCSDYLDINDATHGTPVCGTNETYNFYRWTSPQPTSQTYSIYMTYQLPSTFKGFASGSTSLMGLTDSSNSTVQYTVYRNNSTSGLSPCGSAVVVSTGVQTSWQTKVASGTADPSTCGFAAGDSLVFKIDVIASSNANAYVGNIGFTFSNK